MPGQKRLAKKLSFLSPQTLARSLTLAASESFKVSYFIVFDSSTKCAEPEIMFNCVIARSVLCLVPTLTRVHTSPELKEEPEKSVICLGKGRMSLRCDGVDFMLERESADKRRKVSC